MEVLPWILCAGALLVLLVMVCLDGSKRRPAGTRSMFGRARADAAKTRKEVRKATRANLDRIAGAMESDNAEQKLADELNRKRDGER